LGRKAGEGSGHIEAHCGATPWSDEPCRTKAVGLSDEEEVGRRQEGRQEATGVTQNTFAIARKSAFAGLCREAVDALTIDPMGVGATNPPYLPGQLPEQPPALAEP